MKMSELHGRKENNDEAGVDFESLVKGMEDIQDHALQQHEQHLDTRVYLRSLEGKIEKVCHTTKQIKNKNMEDEGVLHSLQCKNSELKQLIARESALVLAAEERKEAMQRLIDKEKEEYIQSLQLHEELMAKFSDKFRKAPQVYSKGKLQEETKNEAQELQALNAKELIVVKELDELNEELNKLNEDQDLPNLRTLVEEVENKLLQEQKGLKKDKKKLVKTSENLKKIVEELAKMTN